MRLDPGKTRRVRRRLVAWYLRHRRDLPWRRTRDPYAILVSEVMLQQTQVDRVIPKFRAWLKRFPTVRALARATPRDVLLAWEGMGYNRRAVSLLRAAKEIEARFGGVVPAAPDDLETLPGVGRYTAAAVATFAGGELHPLADTNVRRVIFRVFAGVRPPKARGREQRLLRLVSEAMPREAVRSVPARDWGHVVMDFGALVCRATPRCHLCPVRSDCRAHPRILAGTRPPRARRATNRARPHPDRIYRGRIVQLARDRDPRSIPVREIGPAIFPGWTRRDRPWLDGLVAGLVRDYLLAWEEGKRAVRLPRR